MRGCMHQPIVTMSWQLAPTNCTGRRRRRRRLESMVNRLIGVNFHGSMIDPMHGHRGMEEKDPCCLTMAKREPRNGTALARRGTALSDTAALPCRAVSCHRGLGTALQVISRAVPCCRAQLPSRTCPSAHRRRECVASAVCAPQGHAPAARTSLRCLRGNAPSATRTWS